MQFEDSWSYYLHLKDTPAEINSEIRREFYDLGTYLENACCKKKRARIKMEYLWESNIKNTLES